LHIFDCKDHQVKADSFDRLRIKYQERSLAVLAFRAFRFKLKKSGSVSKISKVHFDRRNPNDVFHAEPQFFTVGLSSGNNAAVRRSTE